MLEIILTLARQFREQGYELYMVGGAVRDLLLQRDAAMDADLTTNARPDQIKRLVASTHPSAVITLGEKFGTVRLHYAKATSATATNDADVANAANAAIASPTPAAVVASGAADVDIIEITTYRSDRYDPDSRKPEVTFGDTLQDDLLRRDFTINAMARDPLTGEVFDPYGGRDDLEHGIIRAVGNDPEHRFDEDPLRLLRAARFAAQFNFTIESATLAAMQRQAATLQKISRERIRDEFTKLLQTSHPGLGIRLLVDLDLMPYIVPEVLELRGVSQKATAATVRTKDVYDHVLRVVERAPARAATRWAGLLHDIAKPRTRSVEDGKVHFLGHEDVGAHMSRDILRRLKFDRPFIEHVTKMVRMHMRINGYLPDWTDGAVRRIMLEADEALPDLLDLSRADITSYRPDKVSRAMDRIKELENRCIWLREEAERVPIKSPLDGDDLMRLFERGPGPWLRPLKDYLLGLVIDGKLAPDDYTGAEAEARRFLAAAETTETATTETATTETATTETATTDAANNTEPEQQHGSNGQPLPPKEQQATTHISKAEARAANRRRSRHETASVN